MLLKLNVYTDESMNEVKRVCEAEKLRIPYRVGMYIIQSLDTVNLNNEDDIFKFITSNVDKMDKIIKATFGVTDSELDCVDGSELVAVLVELYKWGLEKIADLKSGKDSKNLITPAVNS